MVKLNLLYINELKRFLAEISDDIFLTVSPQHQFSGSIGAHSRHVIEFYTQFIKSQKSGLIDYDARLRNKAIETDKSFAINELKLLAEAFTNIISDENISLICKNNGRESRTSLGRELSYLAEHTNHHFALIRLIAETQNFSFDHMPSFGIAPSTLNFRSSQNN